MKRIVIIGHFANGEMDHYDGQTIKTKNLESLLVKQSDICIKRVDTHYSKNNKLKLFLESVCALFWSEYIFLLVSVNGMKFYLPFLHYLNKLTRRKIYHYIIGSELLDLVKEDPKLVKYLNSLSENWFEYESGTKYLQSQGVKNVSTLPNFKVITPLAEPIVFNCESKVLRFCTFSRVMEEKGITEAIETIRKINDEHGEFVATLDIYGQLDPSYESKFIELLQVNSDCVTYKGIVDSQASVDVLKNYYALLFPTRWVGEGFPGTIIDAFAAGIPIIASDWNANKEIVQNGKQGVIYPNDEVKTLKDAVEYSLIEKEKMIKMRIESRKAFDRYTPNSILSVILEKMNLA